MTPTLLWLLACGDPAPKDRTLDFDTTLPPQDSQGVEPVAACRRDAAPLGPDTCVEEAPCAWSGGAPGEGLGAAVAIGPDLDGDGLRDLALGAPGFVAGEGADALNDAGRVMIVSGASLSAEAAPRVLGELRGDEAMGWLGSAVVLAGDVDGDGWGDLWVGANGQDAGGLAEAGALHLVRGRAGGWGGGVITADARVQGGAEYGRVGQSLAAGGDVDGDGLADTWAAGGLKRFDGDRELSAAGEVALLLGRREGFDALVTLADADAHLRGQGSGDELGRSLAGGADLDGDGHDDLVAGAPYANGYRGAALAWPGGPDAFEGQPAAPVQLLGEASYDHLGYALAVGDLDGDGVAELAVGVALSDLGGDGAGEVRVYAGGSGFFTEGPALLGRVVGDQEDTQLGTGLSVGDLDGDGLGDLVMGSVLSWRGLVTKGGRATVRYGREGGWPQGESTATLTARVHGASVRDYLGADLAAGDLDGDGRDELLLGSAFADVSGGGDVGGAWLFWGAAP